MEEIAREWFLKALDLKPGEELFIPCTSRRDARKMVTALGHCKQYWMKFDPLKAMAVNTGFAVRFNSLWVKVFVKEELPNAVYIKGVDGVTRALTIEGISGERDRKITVMLQDGLSREEIEGLLGGLSESEREKYFKENE